MIDGSWHRAGAKWFPLLLPRGYPCSLHSSALPTKKANPLTQVLRRSERVVLVEQGADIAVVVPASSAMLVMAFSRQGMMAHSFPLDRMIRIPPRATSLNLTWNPRKSAPTTKNMPNGFLGYSTSGRNDGSSRNDRATSGVCQLSVSYGGREAGSHVLVGW